MSPFTTARPHDYIKRHGHTGDTDGGRLRADELIGFEALVVISPPAPHTHPWSDITATPTTIAGYGITDFNALGDARWSLLAHTHTFASLTSKPTTIAGYGITDFNSLGDARWSLLGHVHAFSSLTGIPTTIAGYGLTTDFNTQGDARWAPLASGGYVTLATPQTITGAKSFVNSAAGDGFIITQGASQLTTDKLFMVQSIGGTQKITYTTGGGFSLLDGKLNLGKIANQGGVLTMFNGSTGGTLNFYPQAVGAGVGNLVAPDLSGLTHFVVTSANSLVNAGTIPIIGKAGDPPSGAQQVGVVNRTLTANVAGPVLLTNTAPAGFYFVTVYMRCTVNGSGSPALRLTYNDGAAVTNLGVCTITAMSTAAFPSTGMAMVKLASGDITWNVAGYVSGAYTLHIRTTYLGA